MNRKDMPWCDLPTETTVDDIMARLWKCTEHYCNCGGKGPNDPDACATCDVWHFVMGRQKYPDADRKANA